MELTSLYTLFTRAKGISTDSRNVLPNSIFFALRGEKFNGNDFAIQALEQGAAWAVVDDNAIQHDRIIHVQDCLTTLQELAKHHRKKFSIPVIGITGSNGKTTTKELVTAVLKKKYNTHATGGNLNNHLGVPLTILGMNEQTEIAIIEMGANHVGEIEQLCQMAQPTHGVITNIGKAHIGTFGGYDMVIKAKTELHKYLMQHNGVVFINSADDSTAPLARRFEKPILYGVKNSFSNVKLISADPYLIVESENGYKHTLQLIGEYNFQNVQTAYAIGKYFEVDENDITKAIIEYVPENMRSQVIRRGGHTLILDAYNANPTSMEAALISLSRIAATFKVAIIGDMMELGDDTASEHKKIGALLHSLHFQQVFICGKYSREMLSEAPEAHYFETREQLAVALQKVSLPPATILIKASRSMELDKIVDFLPS